MIPSALLVLMLLQAPDKAGVVHEKKTTTDRLWYLYVPASYKPGVPMPLVITSAGRGGTGKGEIRGWDNLAQKHKFIVASPDMDVASGRGQSIEGDEKVILEIYDYITQRFTVDKKSVMVTGFSGGGIPTYYMGSRYPEKFPYWCPRGGNYYPHFVDDENLKKCVDTVHVYIFWGEKDHELILEQAPQATERLKKAGLVDLKTEVIPGMGHQSRPEIAAEWFEKAVAENRQKEALKAPAVKSMAEAEKLLGKGKLADAVKELVKADKHLKKNKLGDEAARRLDALADEELKKAAEKGGEEEATMLLAAKKAFEGAEAQKKISARLKELGKE